MPWRWCKIRRPVVQYPPLLFLGFDFSFKTEEIVVVVFLHLETILLFLGVDDEVLVFVRITKEVS